MTKIKEELIDSVKNRSKAELAIMIVIWLAGLFVMGFAFKYFYTYAFSVAGKGIRYKGYFALIYIAMLAVTLYFVYFLTIKRSFEYTKLFLVITIGYSIAMQLVMPPISGADEAMHFISAYHASDIIMGKKDQIVSTDGGATRANTTYFYEMRQEDTEYYYVNVTFPDQYETIIYGNWFGVDKDKLEHVMITDDYVSWYRYIFAGLGIAIARWLKLGMMSMLFLGRFMNSLFLIIAGYFSIKLIPRGKAQIIAFVMSPMVLQLCSSYSYDTLSIVCTMLLASLIYYFAQPEVTFKFYHVFLILAVYALLLPNKMVYVAFGFMLFIIPWKRYKGAFGSEKIKFFQSKLWKVIRFFILFAFVIVVLYMVFKVLLEVSWTLQRTYGSTIEQDGSRASFTLDYMIMHPDETWAYIFNSIKQYWVLDMLGIMGKTLGHHRLNVSVPTFIILIMWATVIAGIFVKRGKGYNARAIVFTVISMVVVYIFIYIGCMIRFTPTEGSDRVQIAYRYYLPIFEVFLMMLGTDSKENKATLGLLYVQNLALVGALTYSLIYLMNWDQASYFSF